MTRRSDVGELTADGQHSKPFYLFADNLSDKEDFYFALLKNMERRYDDPHSAPVPLQFDVKHIIDLVKHLHSSEENMQTRWFNALLGRIFLGVYKTTDIQNFIKAKITKKISRVKKPSFLSKIVIRSVDLGEGAPSITNPRLKDLTVDGDCTIEADMLYTGKARVEIAATARIELGSRFKAREVDLVLAVTCKRIEGHMLFRVKPPPSNRMWMTFEHPPRMDLSIEPIVSSRQITYNVILRQIESRIKEVIAETVVMPFWDDLAFFNTEGKTWRAGVFVDSAITRPAQSVEDAIAEEGDVDAVEQAEAELASPDSKQGSPFSPPIEKSMSTPALDASPPATFASKAARSVFNLGSTKPNGSSKSVDVKPAGSETPRSLRRSSNATPVVRVDGATVGAVKSTPSGQATSAASSMAAISAKSPPVRTPVGSPENVSKLPMDDASSFSSGSSKEASQSTDGSMAGKDPANFMVKDGHLEMNISKDHLHSRSQSHDLNNTPSKFKFDATNHRNSNISMMTTGSTDSGSSRSSTKKSAALNAVANAAENARKWGLNALQRTRESAKSISEPELPPDLSQPMGRGQPLPPIGTPLPKPERSTKTAPMPVPKRKPLPPPDMSQDQLDKEARAKLYAQASERHLPPPVIPKRRPVPQNNAQDDENDGIFIVPAPYSEPPSPTESRKEYMSPSVEEEVENEYAQEQMLSKPPPPPLPRRRRDSDGAASDSEEVKGDLATENILVVRA